ncbi:MAG TPA: lipoyl(octanoyl) transferase LipB [Phycisphaeraceae bacterium]
MTPDAPSTTPAMLRVLDLGRIAYAPALEEQRRINQAVAQGQEPPTLLLLEHDPVITLSQRRSSTQHLLATPQRLSALGIDVQPTDRGGDITYHGPGQLVAYPILRLAPLGLNLGRYMRLLEKIVIDTLAAWGVQGLREPGATGVWVRLKQHRLETSSNPDDSASGDAPLAKICAMGVRVRQNTTMHGLALNVTTDLSHFDTIIPCGLAGRAVTSLQQILGPRTPTMPQVKDQLALQFRKALDARQP